MTATVPIRAVPSKEPFYSNRSFNMMAPIAVVYSTFAHLALFLSKPLPFPPFRIPVTDVDNILPQHKFVVSKEIENVAIVTGSNTGIGFETAASLVHQGYTVILACRSRDKGQSAVDKINQSIVQNLSNSKKGNGETVPAAGKAEFLHPLDLSSLQSVRSFARAFTEKYTHLNILVNNAGINSSGTTSDGMELCFQTNFVGHYLLTRLVLPHLLQAKNTFPPVEGGEVTEAGRVVNLSSVTHHFAGCNEPRNGGSDYVNQSGRPDAAWWKATAAPGISDNTYKESKLAALLFTHALNKRFKANGLHAVSANPGAVNSDIWRNFPAFMDRIHRLIYLNTKEGAATSIAASISKLPDDAIYLQPYWQPFKNIRGKVANLSKLNGLNQSFGDRWYASPFPIFEMLGPCVGFAITEPRLPSNPDDSSDGLWDACEELVGGK